MREKGFVSCKIIVNSEKDKREFLKACRHLHDFSVFYNKNRKVTEVVDEYRGGKGKDKIRDISDSVGVSLNLDDYPFVNFLAHLYNTDYPEIQDKFIIVKKGKNGNKKIKLEKNKTN